MAISGDIRCLVQANNGDILAGVVGSAQIYKSSDDGVSWSLLHTFGAVSTDAVRTLVKTSIGQIFAAVTCTGANRGLWRSIDNGASWTQIISLSASPTAITDDGAWDICVAGTYTGIVLKDEENGNGVVVKQYNFHSLSYGIYPLPNVNASAYLDNRYPPFAISALPVWNYDTRKAYYLVATNQFATQAFRVKDDDTIAQMLPTSSMGAQSTADAGQRDLTEFVLNYQGSVRHTTLLATYRSIATAGTEIWALEDLRYPTYATPNNYFVKIAAIADTVRGLYADPADLSTPGDYATYPQHRTVWGAGNGNLWVSYNNGYTWQLATAGPANQLYTLLRTSAGTLIAAGDSAEVFRYTGAGGPGGGEPGGGGEEEPGGDTGGGDTGAFTQNTAVLGREATTTGLVAVANKFALSTITHIFNYDGADYTHLQFEENPPYTLFDAAPDVGHMVYFGSRTADPDVPSGPFTSVVINLTQVAQGISGWIWEYWDGATWSELDVTDGSNGFAEAGETSIHWTVPDDWAATTVDGTTGYWVRVRITGVEASTTPPIHGGRFVYALNLPFVELSSAQVGGDLPAPARVAWRNLADNLDGSVDLAIDRLLVGLRSYARGPNFTAYLNISDAALPFGQTVTDLFDDGAFVDSLFAPTARAYEATHSSGDDLDAWVDLVEISLDTTIARDWYGVYRGFLRCAVDSPGTATTWKFRVEVAFGSGGGRALSQEAHVNPAQTEFVTLDLGRIAIPVSSTFAIGRNIADTLTLTVQGYCTTQSVTARLYDLILIPVDEWAGEARLPDTSDATLSNKVEGGDVLEYDSIGNPKHGLDIYHRQPSALIQTLYRQIANGPALLQANVRQRLWFVGMRYQYSSGGWTADPANAGAVQVAKQQRYLGLRGNR